MPIFFTYNHTPKVLKGKSSLTVFTALTLLAALCSPSVAADEPDDWWFDVEVIVFKRNIELQEVAETFPRTEATIVSQPYVDLLTPYITPNLDFLTASMPLCRQSEQARQDSQQLKTLQTLNQVAFEKAEMRKAATTGAGSLIDTPVEATFEPTFGLTIKPTAEPIAEPTVEGNPDSSNDEDDIPAIERLLSVYDETLALSPPNVKTPFIDWHLPAAIPCTYQQPDRLLQNPFEAPAPEPFIAKVPVQFNGQERTHPHHPHLLSQSALRLSPLYRDIKRQRELSPILHLAWRQSVLFGRDKAVKFRLFAGNNYANKYSQSGELLPPPPPPKADERLDIYSADLEPSGEPSTSPAQDVLFDKIYAALADPSPIAVTDEVADPDLTAIALKKVKELWQLDGEFKVYLQHVGTTPYLHIDSELDYRIPVVVENKPSVSGDTLVDLAPVNADLGGDTARQTSYLQSVKFKQLRRVISTQLHYFDHPLFGMVVQINRYKRPEPESEPEAEAIN